MVHAEASAFAEGVTKEEAYAQVLEQAESLFEGQRNWVWFVWLLSNLANTSSLLWHAFKSLPSPSGSVNWAGFYVLDPASPSQLILGPFHGQVACQTIAFGKGVCGTVAASRKSLVVKDVEEFPGHIPCDGASRSEIVVPILVTEGKTERLVGIIDIDCAEVDGFDDLDRKKLEKLAALVTRSCDWPEIDWVSGLEEGIKKL